MTGWTQLAPGTLNLEVDVDLTDPVWTEAAKTVKGAPNRRIAYLYYRGTAQGQDILVRKAQVPIPHRVEILAPVNLRKTLSLSDGDNLTIRI